MKDWIIFIINEIQSQLCRNVIEISTKEYVELQGKAFWQISFLYINVITDTSITNEKFLKTNENYVFYLFFEKII